MEANVRSCTECAHYDTCKTFYDWIGCNPEPKEEPESGA